MATEKPAPQSRAKEPAPAAAGKGALTDLVLDLEETLGNTLGNVPPAPVPAQPARMAAAASGDGRQATMSATATATTSAPASTRGAIGHATAEMGLSQTDSELADIFSEFKEGLADEGRGPTEGEDPETHYNLGVAFKEMGLLDEAIGELQKVCQAVEQGHSFPQVMQAYTWLAQCFLEKGVPQASVRWYEKALNIPAIDNEARVALHYELAAAYEAADNKQAALNHFMEVYGSNIDYRDVAERIKSLKS
jgi:tetratricopeptide (TPR) repeat protein